MPTPIKIIKKEHEPTLEIRMQCTMLKMPMMIRQSYMLILTYLEELGEEMSGMPYVRYLNLNWDTMLNENKLMGFIRVFTRKWDMAIGFPVKKELEERGDIKPGGLPEGRYIRTIHYGPYQKVGDTYKLMTAYAEQKGITIQNESFEIYLNDPGKVSKERLETEVLIPVKE